MAEADGEPKTLPFRAEYAKSGRAKCKGCSAQIGKDELRMAKMVQSPFFDGMQANWYHFDCFFTCAKPKTVGDIAHYETLRSGDQKRIQKKIDTQHPSSSKDGASNLHEFKIEYAKSSKSVCPACENPLRKQELRIGKIDYDSDATIKFGVKVYRWYHVKCFVEIRDGLEFFVSGTKIEGYRDLEQEDQELIKASLPPSKKRKLTGGEESKPSKRSKEDIKLDKMIKKQNDALYQLKDQLSKAIEDKGKLKMKQLKQFLEHNDQDVPVLSKVLERLVDVMIHGALTRCTVCKNGQYVYRSGVGYYCVGHLSEFAKCANVTEDPERVPFKLPKDLDDEIFVEYPFLEEYRVGKVSKRIMPKHAATVDAKPILVHSTAEAGPSTDNTLRSSAYAGPRVNFRPLAKFRFVLDPSIANDDLGKKVEGFGGKLLKSIGRDIAAFITTKAKIKVKDNKFMGTAKDRGIPVVSADFINNIKEANFDLADEISKHLIVDWMKPNEIKPYLTSLNPDFEKKPADREEKKKGEYEKEMKRIKLKMKNGAVVDPDSEMEASGHVYKEGNQFFTSVLNKVDVEQGKNSYYKCQIIESDHGKNYYIFRSWGRVGTTIGGKQTDPQPDLESAKEIFYRLYLEKSGNEFGKPFKIKPDAYVPMDIDFGEKKQMEKLVPDTKASKLELPVQKLICKIFDVENMQKTLMEFEIDLEKMPLGKISRNQIMQAYSALNDTMKLLDGDDKQPGTERRLIEVTNRFFTLIPHNFGIKNAPLLKEIDYVKTKLDMLDNLLEIELAYELLLKGDEDTSKAPIDAHYDSLKCSIRNLEQSSQMWNILEKYLKNTHAPTHMDYALEIANIFAVDRKGENKRYKPFKDFHNRKLLWHGSRTANYAGILSQGLRIAPPEAPVTGYMFGKGVYFADMVSKSANYCYPHRSDPSTGLLLLCEVALGDMAELTDAKDTLLKAPSGKHSVKGLGITIPDPSDEFVLPTGVVVPYGKPTKTDVKKTSLLYNEYIVYDTAQVNILYLVEVKFKHNERK